MLFTSNESVEQLSTHYLLGGLVESLIISDLYKQYYNNLKVPHLYFWRDNHGHELDCVIEKAIELIPVEIKSGKTIAKDYFKGLEYWYNLTDTNPNGYVIYGGDQTQSRTLATVLSWKDIDQIL